MALAAVWNSAAAEQISAEYVAGVGATDGGGGGGGGGGALTGAPCDDKARQCRRNDPRGPGARATEPIGLVDTGGTGHGASSSFAVDALVNVSDGAVAMVDDDKGVDLTPKR